MDELIPEQGTGLQGTGGWLAREGGRYGVGSGQLGESKEQGVAGFGGVKVADNMEYSPPHQGYPTLIPRTCDDVASYGKRDFAGMKKRILRWRDCSGLSRWPKVIARVLLSGRQEV